MSFISSNMSLNKYLKGQEKAKKVADTLMYNLRQAYLEAEGTCIQRDGLVNLNSLKHQTNKDKFEKTFINSISEDMGNYFHIDSTTNLDIFQKSQLLKAYMGFSGIETHALVDGLGENMNYDNFFKSLEKPINTSLETIMQTPASYLKPGDAGNVVNYVESNNIDPSKLRIEDMVNVISEYKKNGSITPNFLNNKPYKL